MIQQSSLTGSEYPSIRREAKRLGALHYFTGKPCIEGHTAPRYTASGHCFICQNPSGERPGNPRHRRVRHEYVAKQCAVCEKPLPYEQRQQLCCSRRCGNTLTYRLRDGLSCAKSCGICGNEFIAKAAQFYCGPICKRKARDKCAGTRTRYFARLLLIRNRREILAITDLEMLWEAQGGFCALTGRPMTVKSGMGHVPSNASIDRKIPALGYALQNIQLTQMAVNRLKAELSPAEFIDLCRDVVRFADASTRPT